MKQFSMSIAVLLLGSLCAAPAFASGGGVGNGGGVLVRHGAVVTFESAKILVHPIPAALLPGLKSALSGVESLQINAAIKSRFETGLKPTSARNFFRLNPTEVAPATFAAILKQYKNLQRIGEISQDGQIALAAITEGSDTYLLPDFFRLRDGIAQGALLFHEALRAIYPDLETELVVRLEMAFESFLRGENAVQIYYEIAHNISPQEDRPLLQAYVRHDVVSGAFGALATAHGSEPELNLGMLIGKRVRLSVSDPDSSQMVGVQEKSVFRLAMDSQVWLSNLNALQERFPNSLILRLFSQDVSDFLPVLWLDGNCFGSPDFSDLRQRSIQMDFSATPDSAQAFEGMSYRFVFAGNWVTDDAGCSSRIDFLFRQSYWSDPVATQMDFQDGILLSPDQLDRTASP